MVLFEFAIECYLHDANIKANLFFTIALQIHAYEQKQKKNTSHNETSFNTILNLHARNTLLFNLILFLYDAAPHHSVQNKRNVYLIQQKDTMLVRSTLVTHITLHSNGITDPGIPKKSNKTRLNVFFRSEYTVHTHTHCGCVCRNVQACLTKWTYVPSTKNQNIQLNLCGSHLYIKAVDKMYSRASALSSTQNGHPTIYLHLPIQHKTQVKRTLHITTAIILNFKMPA